MNTTSKIFLAALGTLMIIPEADGVMGVRRRTHRRTAVVVGTTVHAADSAAMAQSQQQAAAAQQQAADSEAAAAKQEAAAAQQQAAAAQQQAAAPPVAQAPAAAGGKLPLGTVVSTLPPGAVATPVNGVEYYYGGGNFYRTAFQGNQLVYVTAEPK